MKALYGCSSSWSQSIHEAPFPCIFVYLFCKYFVGAAILITPSIPFLMWSASILLGHAWALRSTKQMLSQDFIKHPSTHFHILPIPQPSLIHRPCGCSQLRHSSRSATTFAQRQLFRAAQRGGNLVGSSTRQRGKGGVCVKWQENARRVDDYGMCIYIILHHVIHIFICHCIYFLLYLYIIYKQHPQTRTFHDLSFTSPGPLCTLGVLTSPSRGHSRMFVHLLPPHAYAVLYL